MSAQRTTPQEVTRYVAAVTAAAVVAAALVVRATPAPFGLSDSLIAYLTFGALLLVGEFMPVRWLGQKNEGEVTATWAFAFALLLLVPAPAAIAMVVATSTVGDVARRKGLLRLAFNGSQLTIAMALATVPLHIVDQDRVLGNGHTPGIEWLLAVVAAGLLALLANGVLTTCAVALATRQRPRELLRAGALSNLSADSVMFGLGPIFVVVAQRSALLVPLLLGTTWGVYRSLAISAQREFEATHDSLTSLPNRRLFEREFHTAVDAARRSGERTAVVVIDLNGFKEINDLLGHHAGDVVLEQVANRLAAAQRDSDTLARLGGDEYGIVLAGLPEGCSVVEIARRMVTELDEAMEVEGVRIAVSASAGLAVYPADGRDEVELMRAADFAMYRAKDEGGGLVAYSGIAGVDHESLFAPLQELPDAVAAGHIVLDYQPCMDVRTGNMVGVEALVRWEHPVHGRIFPNSFIPVVEQTEWISMFTEHVLRMALEQSARWRRAGLELRVAVNCSAMNLVDLTFPQTVKRIIGETGADPSWLELELTEHAIVRDKVRVAATMAALRAIGVSLSIDDFGTGFSALSSLRELPLDRVKIDKSFVAQMTSNAADAAIVLSLIAMTHALGIEVVAEGVEQVETLTMLRAQGCDYVQGYLFSPPVRPVAIAGLAPGRPELLRATG